MTEPRLPRTPTRALGTVVNEALKQATTTGEMADASMRTIQHRTQQMGEAMLDPKRLNDPEFQLMVSEKMEAASASGTAMAMRLGDAAAPMMRWFGRQTSIGMTGLAGLMSARTPLASLSLMQRQMMASTENAAKLATELTRVAQAVTKAGMAPVHSAVTKNARRLGKQR